MPLEARLVCPGKATPLATAIKRLSLPLHQVCVRTRPPRAGRTNHQPPSEFQMPRVPCPGLSLGDVPNRQPIGIVLTVLGVVVLDFSADATEGPIRAYLLDVVDSEEQDMALNIHAFSAGEKPPTPTLPFLGLSESPASTSMPGWASTPLPVAVPQGAVGRQPSYPTGLEVPRAPGGR